MQLTNGGLALSFTVCVFFSISVFASFPTIYSTLKLLVQGSEGCEPLNPPATGNPSVLKNFVKRRVRVVVTISSYNDNSIYRVLDKWLIQNYPDYYVVVLEDGGLSYEKYGDVSRFNYEYVNPKDKLVNVSLEKIHLSKGDYTLDSFIVVRRGCRDGFKAGALNNFIEITDRGVLREIYDLEKPDYMVIIDADHEPGGNPWLRLLLGRTVYELNYTERDYEKIRVKLVKYEEVGRELLGIDDYKLDPRLMDNPISYVTRTVELMEYHKIFIPKLAVIQGYQNHLFSRESVLDLLVYSSHVLSQYAMITRSPRVKIEVLSKNDNGLLRVYRAPERVFKKTLYRKWILCSSFERGDKIFRTYVSEHAMPLFTGSSAIVDYDIASKYRFADGIFVDYNSLTEDWEFSIRITKDNYLIFATHQFETIAKPPRDLSTYKKQQFRWAYGTISDIKKRYSEIMSSKNMTRLMKLSYLIQGSYYFPNTIWVYGLLPVSIALAYASSNTLLTLLTILTSIYVIYGDTSPHLKVVPGLRRKLKILGGVLLNNILLTPVLAKACYKALKNEKTDWVVTLKAD
ncbi:MAG: glycosyltransferase family 2 protein [Desulfurococcaceae archaeon]